MTSKISSGPCLSVIPQHRSVVTFGTTPTVARTMRFERVQVDGVNRAREVRDYAAGKAVNAARAAVNLGDVAVVCTGCCGGARGSELLKMLAAEGMRHEFWETSTPTRLCVTVLDDSTGTATELIEESQRIAADEGAKCVETFATQARSHGGVAVLSGSLAPGLSAGLYADCISAAHQSGVPVILDASGEPLRAAVGTKPDVVKINAGELQTVEPSDGSDDPISAGGRLASRTGGWVIITRGSRSTLAVHATFGCFEVGVPRVERVVSTIGSGDSFAGGLAASLARGDSMQDALRFAAACATANVMTADAAHFDRSAVVAFVEDVRVTPLRAC